MPQVTITVDVTNDQLLALLNGQPIGVVQAPPAKAWTPGKSYKVGDTVRAPLSFKPGQGRNMVPKLPAACGYYRRQPDDNDGCGGSGRRSILNVAGQRLAWSLYNQGYNFTEISRAFGGLIGRDSVRNLIKQVKAFGNKDIARDQKEY